MAGKEKQRIMGKLVKEELAEMGVLEDDVDSYKKKKVVTGGGGKKCSGGGGGGGMKCCQAEKCVADLTDAKPYYRRHKVCEHHSKAQIVLVDGIRKRFCQQCSRFHEVSEFDDMKRSCRRRLAGHNERRRKNVEGSSHKGEKQRQLEDAVFGQIDDRRRIKITVKENVTYKNFQIR